MLKTLNSVIILLSCAIACIGAERIILPPHINDTCIEFQRTKNPDYLSKAMSLIDRQKKNSNTHELELQVAFLGNIASEYDPSYDSSPPPLIQTHVPPPPGYDSGVSARSIEDPVSRADYEKRIAANADNARRHQIQTFLRRLIKKIAARVLKVEDGSIEKSTKSIQKMRFSKEIFDALDKELRKI